MDNEELSQAGKFVQSLDGGDRLKVERMKVRRSGPRDFGLEIILRQDDPEPNKTLADILRQFADTIDNVVP